jgi:hypothetical protein
MSALPSDPEEYDEHTAAIAVTDNCVYTATKRVTLRPVAVPYHFDGEAWPLFFSAYSIPPNYRIHPQSLYSTGHCVLPIRFKDSKRGEPSSS